MDTGDYIVVVNAEKIRVTGNKEKGKIYWRHTGYPGGIKGLTWRPCEQSTRADDRKRCAWNVAEKSAGAAMFRKLKVYAGDEHPHAAQQPQVLELST